MGSVVEFIAWALANRGKRRFLFESTTQQEVDRLASDRWVVNVFPGVTPGNQVGRDGQPIALAGFQGLLHGFARKPVLGKFGLDAHRAIARGRPGTGQGLGETLVVLEVLTGKDIQRCGRFVRIQTFCLEFSVQLFS